MKSSINYIVTLLLFLILGVLISTSNGAFAALDDNSKIANSAYTDSVDRARRAELRDERKKQREQDRIDKAEADMTRRIDRVMRDEVNQKYLRLALLIGLPMAFILLIAFRRRKRRRQLLEEFVRNKQSGPNIKPLDPNNSDLRKNL